MPANAQEIIVADEPETTDVTEQPVVNKVYNKVRLRGLNKITARSEEIEATMGAVTSFANLEIIPRGCWVAPDNKSPEQAGLLEVWYWKQGEKPTLIFFGWMFASSPALSSLEHPLYDITMLECLQEKPEESTDAEEKTDPLAANPQTSPDTASTPASPTHPSQ